MFYQVDMYELYLSVFILQFVWMTMKKYRCYFCSSIDDSLEDIVDHCIDSHSKNTLKYRELELDERSGKLRYQTQIHAGVIPSNIENDGKTIIVSKDFFLRDWFKTEKAKHAKKGSRHQAITSIQ